MIDDPAEIARLMEETKEYYRQRAAHFGEWHRNTENYEGGPPLDQSYVQEAKMLFDALDAERLEGNVLEIAAGTGIWTEAVIKTASALTALDSSREMLEKCKTRLGINPKIRYVVADFFEWTPDREYDAVTFSFMISHVPASKLDEFALKLFNCLKPRGEIFFVDQQVQAIKNEKLDQSGGEVVWRNLGKGKKFRIFKHFYTPEEIERSFLACGIRIKVTNTHAHFFLAKGYK